MKKTKDPHDIQDQESCLVNPLEVLSLQHKVLHKTCGLSMREIGLKKKLQSATKPPLPTELMERKRYKL